MPHRPPRHRPADRPQYDRTRPSAAGRGYGRAWQRLRKWILDREPICRICQRAAASVVDHITPRAAGGSDDVDNLQPLCKPCHDRKTATVDHGFGR